MRLIINKRWFDSLTARASALKRFITTDLKPEKQAVPFSGNCLYKEEIVFKMFSRFLDSS